MNVFNSTHAIDLAELTLTMKEEYESIPDNWISDKMSTRFFFSCGSKTVARNAFHATQNYTSTFELSNCLFQDSAI